MSVTSFLGKVVLFFEDVVLRMFKNARSRFVADAVVILFYQYALSI